MSFGSTTLTPSVNAAGTVATVSISSALLYSTAISDSPDTSLTNFPVSVTVNNPDASGLTTAGHVNSSNTETFEITPPSMTTQDSTSPGTQCNVVGKTLTPLQIPISDPDAIFNPASDLTTGLPTGLSINSSGLITGTPTTAGLYSVDVTTLDDGVYGTNTFNWEVYSVPTLSYTTPQSVSTGAAMTPIDPMLTVSGANANVTFALASGTLPAGVSVSLTTGVISGTPTGVGITGLSQTYTFTIGATNVIPAATGTSNSVSLTVYVTPALSYTSPATVATGVAMTALDPTVTPSGVTSYSLGSGALPAGVSFSPTTGVISGTPTGVGITGLSQTYTFTIDATNGVAVGASNTVSLTVDVTPTLSYTSPVSVATGVAMTALDPTVTPSGVTSYSLGSGAAPPPACRSARRPAASPARPPGSASPA